MDKVSSTLLSDFVPEVPFLDVNISIHLDRSLILSQAATTFQWIIKPGSPPSLKYLGRTLIGFELVRPLICVPSKPVVNITLAASSLQQP